MKAVFTGRSEGSVEVRRLLVLVQSWTAETG